jgi:predicted nucleic acid-binding protein
VIVVDASVVANAVGDDGADGVAARAALRGQDLAAPDLLDVEVLAVLRRRWLAGDLGDSRFDAAVGDLMDLPIARQPMAGLVRRASELKANVTPYDAVYVALAEAIGVPLLTGDARLAGAPGVRAEIVVLRSA